MLHRLRRDQGRVGRPHPALRLGRLPVSQLAVLIVGVGVQRAAGGQRVHQRRVIQPRRQPIRVPRGGLRAGPLAPRHRAGVGAAVHPGPPRTAPALLGLRAGSAAGRLLVRAGLGDRGGHQVHLLAAGGLVVLGL